MDESKFKAFKNVVEMKCPHCDNIIMISQSVFIPTINWVLKKKDLEKSKDMLKEEVLKSTSINDKEKNSLIEWINSDDVYFGPDDVNNIMQEILSRYKENNKK